MTDTFATPLSFPRCLCPLCTPASANTADTASTSTVYSASVSSASVPYYIAALLPSGTPRWGNGSVGTAASVTYSFMESVPAYASNSDRNGFAPMSAAQRAATRLALASWSTVAGITFTEVSGNGSRGSIRFGTNTQDGASAAYAYYPSSSSTGGDVYLANDITDNATPTLGSYAFLTLVHEIGHAIGLKHPGNYNAGGGETEDPYLPSGEDNNQYSVMSYYSHPGIPSSTELTAPSLYDIAAAQYLYGPNNATNADDTTYQIASSSQEFLSIWDGGGIDTLDASNQSGGVTLNLTAGTFSSIGNGMSQNVVIAYGVTIENAFGGSGNDTITGNTGANYLRGGAGNDALDGGGGNDTIEGENGNDALTLGASGGIVSVSGVETLTGAAGQDWVNLGGSSNSTLISSIETLVGGSGGDWITLAGGGNSLVATALETLVGGAGADYVLLGNRGNSLVATALETLIGGAGADWVYLGNRGNTTLVSALDTLVGGGGNDWITLGNRGNSLVATALETLIGGAGADYVLLGNRGNTTLVSALDTLVGGGGKDWVTLGDGGNSLVATALETLIGGAGADYVLLGNRGNTILVSALDTLAGGGGKDWITLGDGGNSLIATALETLVGGAGNDRVILGDSGNSLVATALETLIGGAGADYVLLGNRGNTSLISNIETVMGGNGIDDLTVTGSTLRFQGNGGADHIRLSGGNDIIVFAGRDDGSAGGSGHGFDQVENFQNDSDTIVIAGSLRLALEQSGDTTAPVLRAKGATNLAADTLVFLDEAVTTLAQDDYHDFCNALGTVATDGQAHTLVVAGSDGSNSGLYLLSDNGDGMISGSEVRLLALFTGVVLGTGSIGAA